VDSNSTSADHSLAIEYELNYKGSRNHFIAFTDNYLLYGTPDSLLIDKFNNGTKHYLKFYISNRHDKEVSKRSSRLEEFNGWQTLSIPLTDFSTYEDYPVRLEKYEVYIVPSDARKDSLHTGTILLDNMRIRNSSATQFKETPANTVQDFALYQNYPNPFNSITQIPFTIHRPGRVKLMVYSILGQNIATLADGYKNSGSYIVQWGAGNVASGIYYVLLDYGDRFHAKRMVLMK